VLRARGPRPAGRRSRPAPGGRPHGPRARWTSVQTILWRPSDPQPPARPVRPGHRPAVRDPGQRGPGGAVWGQVILRRCGGGAPARQPLAGLGQAGLGPFPVLAVVVGKQRQPDRHGVLAIFDQPGDEDQVAQGLGHFLPVETDHPGVRVDLGDQRARGARRRPPGRARHSSHDGERSGRSPPAWTSKTGPRWSVAIAAHSRASPAGRGRSVSPRPARRAVPHARPRRPAGPSCPAGPGRRRARRPARASAAARDSAPCPARTAREGGPGAAHGGAK